MSPARRGHERPSRRARWLARDACRGNSVPTRWPDVAGDDSDASEDCADHESGEEIATEQCDENADDECAVQRGSIEFRAGSHFGFPCENGVLAGYFEKR